MCWPFKTILIVFIVLLNLSAEARDKSMDELMNPTGSPFGGGNGYADLTTHYDYFVKTAAELLQALKKANPGEVIYIDDDAKIDLTGYRSIIVPGGVTIASGRGKGSSKGAVLFTKEDKKTSKPERFHLLETGGPKVRFTGLRLIGPDPARRKQNAYINSIGILASYDSLEVDNCEISGWSLAGIDLKTGSGHYIHHDFIHHNQRRDLGYGVVVHNAEALIEANIFEWNRHAIAGASKKSYRASYEARYNLVLERANGHSFDMHGYVDPVTKIRYAGNRIDIHHNIFYSKAKPVVIRGVPAITGKIHHNWFVFRKVPKDAVLQRKARGGLYIYSNWYTKHKIFIQ